MTPPPTRHRILIVDDNPDVVAMMSDLFALFGHDPRAAFDGPSALAAANDHAPDLVLLDLGLPGMDGCEVARRLRETPAGRAARIVALSGFDHHEARERTADAGFDAHLTKPAGAAALRALLDQI